MSQSAPGQLELFDLSRQQSAVLRRENVGRLMLSVRHDQLILSAIGALIGLTVIFAFGVERGKQIARREAAAALAAVSSGNTQTLAAEAPQLATAVAAAVTAVATPAPAELAAPVEAPETKRKAEPAKAEQAAGKFGIQLVTYSKPQLARQELQRLQGRGEKAFLVTRKGKTLLLAGPFESREDAADRLVILKERYGDGFVKTL